MKLKNILIKVSSLLAFAFMLSGVNLMCASIVYQRKVPEAALKYKQ